MKKFFHNLRVIAHYWFYGMVTAVAGVGMALNFLSFAEGKGASAMALFVLFTAITLIGFAKMVLFSRRHILRWGKKPLMKPKLAGEYAIIFNVILVLTCLAAFWLSRDMQVEDLPTLGSGFEMGQIVALITAVFAVMGALTSWVLCLNIPIMGGSYYIKSFITFAKRYLGVFVLYQVGFALISFICASVVSAAGSTRSSEAAQIVAYGYFYYISDLENGSIMTIALSALSGITAASSYFALSSLAEDSLNHEEHLTLGRRLKRLLFDSDTKYLLIMTVLCIVACVFSGNASGMAGLAFVAVFEVAWLVSLVLYMKNTRIFWIAVNFIIMTFVQTAVPTPAITGIGPALLSFVLVAVRIILFAFVALLIGHDYHIHAIREAAVKENPEMNNLGMKAENAIYNTSILKAGFSAVRLVVNRKEIARNAADKLKDAAIEKAREKFTGKKD